MTQSPTPQSPEEYALAIRKRRQRIAIFGGVLGLVVVTAALAIVLLQLAGPLAGGPAASSAGQPAPPNATPDQGGILVHPGKASPGAPVVELFFDYQCGACQQFEQFYGQVLDQLGQSGEIDLRFRGLIFRDQNMQNDASLRASVGAVCADQVGQFAAYHATVFRSQAPYTDEMLRNEIPVAIGLSGNELTQFTQCYDSKLPQDWVRAANEANFAAGVNATPTLRVNGQDFDFQSSQVAPEQLGDAIKRMAG